MANTITRELIKENLETEKQMILVEALPKKYFEENHLPGALNIPHGEIQNIAPNMLPDKDALIVVYCANTECQNSKIATDTLLRMGYSNTFEYVEGKQHWLDAGFPIESTN